MSHKGRKFVRIHVIYVILKFVMYSGMTSRSFVCSNLIMVHNFNSRRLCRGVPWFSIIIFLSVDNCHLKGHLSKLGLVDLGAIDANKNLKQLHMFCECEALALFNLDSWAYIY